MNKPKSGSKTIDEGPLSASEKSHSLKLCDAYIGINEFKKRVSAFLDNDKETEIVLQEIVNSPLKVDIIERLEEDIVGQDEAKKHLADAIITALETIDPKETGPLKVLFFTGKTGVGKTETARVLGEICFGKGFLNNGVTVIPCEQYQEDITSRNLFGGPKSYVGFGEPTPLSDVNLFAPYRIAKKEGQLHKSIHKLNDFAILVLDEIEKAHYNVRQGLLGILSSGIHEFPTGIEDNPKDCVSSKITNFKNVIIICTSNIGSSSVQQNSLGFNVNDEENIHDKFKLIIKREMEKEFSPEFIGRIDEEICFHDLSEDNCRQIIKKSLEHINKAYGICLNYRVQVELTEMAINQILKEGFSEKYGARPLKRTIAKRITNRIDNYLRGGGIEHMLPGDKDIHFIVDFLDNKFIYKPRKVPRTVLSQATVAKKTVNQIIQTKGVSINHQTLYPNVIPIMAEVLFLEDRYRRAYHLCINEGLAIEKEMRYYEFMLTELGHTEDDIKFQQRLADHGIFDPKDVLATYAHHCNFPITCASIYGIEDGAVNEVINSVIKDNHNMEEGKLKDKIFRAVQFLLGTTLNVDQIKLLHETIGERLNVSKK